MLVPQELVVWIVYIVVPLFNLRLNLRSLTTCQFMIIGVLGRSNGAHGLRKWILLQNCGSSYELLGTRHRHRGQRIFRRGCWREMRIGKPCVFNRIIGRITPTGEVIILDRQLTLPLPFLLYLLLLLLGSLEELTFDKALIEWLRELLLPALVLGWVRTLRGIRP